MHPFVARTNKRSLKSVNISNPQTPAKGASTPNPEAPIKRSRNSSGSAGLDLSKEEPVCTNLQATLTQDARSVVRCSHSVKNAYNIVRRCTGSLGGNGSGGAIYGELTTGSMQKVVDLMVEYCELGPDSLLIDVGSGLGKPNIHVAQYPGVAISYGIEFEHVRWQLSLHNLKHLLLNASRQQQTSGDEGSTDEEATSRTADDKIGHKIYFQFANILDTKTFSPFSHVYMFDIGFPPVLFHELADRFNVSQSPYLICFHGPKLIVDRYGFDVILLAQVPTVMHGSSEGHTAYCYKRAKLNGAVAARSGPPSSRCDPLFKEGLTLVEKEDCLGRLMSHVEDQIKSHFSSPRPSRRSRTSPARSQRA